MASNGFHSVPTADPDSGDELNGDVVPPMHVNQGQLRPTRVSRVHYDDSVLVRPAQTHMPSLYEDGGPRRPARKSTIETYHNEQAQPAPNRRVSVARKSRTERPDLEELKKEIRIDEHTIPHEILYERLRTDPIKGLTSEEAKKRLDKDGPNELTPPVAESEWRKFAHHLFGGFSMLLWIGFVLCLLAYGLQYLTMRPEDITYDNLYLGIALLLVVVLSSVFVYYQERKSADIMNSFKKMVPKFTTVIRDGQKQNVHTVDIIRGDIVQVSSGDTMPADIVIIEAQSFKVDNSSLTGESEAQIRTAKFTSDNPLESKNLAFFSANVMQGTAVGVVIYTGGQHGDWESGQLGQ